MVVEGEELLLEHAISAAQEKPEAVEKEIKNVNRCSNCSEMLKKMENSLICPSCGEIYFLE